jgi:uncharacterized damage-inducible protein DinB
MARELEAFLTTWDDEAKRTATLLRALPATQYDFRAYPGCRSLGELSWHLAELDGYIPHGIVTGDLTRGDRPEGLERPRTVAELAPGFERVHRAGFEKVRALSDADLDRTVKFFDGRMLPIRRMLWDALLHHHLHHRGQLTLVCRLAGGTPIGLFGPTREETEAMKARS